MDALQEKWQSKSLAATEPWFVQTYDSDDQSKPQSMEEIQGCPGIYGILFPPMLSNQKAASLESNEEKTVLNFPEAS